MEFSAVLFTRKTSSPPPKNTSTPSGYLSFLLVKPEPLASSSPLGTAVTAADLACTGQETWRAESFLQVWGFVMYDASVLILLESFFWLYGWSSVLLSYWITYTCLTVFLHNLSPSPLWSTSWSGALYLILHTFLHPVIVSFSQYMSIPSQPVFAVVPRLYPLFLVSLSLNCLLLI